MRWGINLSLICSGITAPVSLIGVCLQVAGLSLIGPLHLLKCNNTGMWCFPMHNVYAAMKTKPSDGEINHWITQQAIENYLVSLEKRVFLINIIW